MVAGLHNNHVHFMGPEWTDAAQRRPTRSPRSCVAMLTRYGFTSVFDTGSRLDDTLALRKRIESGEIAGPRILTAGEPLFPPDGIPIYLRGLPPELLTLMKEPASPDEAVAAVDANLDRGADAIKLFTGSIMGDDVVKPMSVAIAQAAVAEAHRPRRSGVRASVECRRRDDRGGIGCRRAGAHELAGLDAGARRVDARASTPR